MTGEEEFSHIWFICNGAIIHCFMDGTVGGLNGCPPLYKSYSILDRRFKKNEPLVLGICFVELFFMGPLALYLGRLYATERSVLREIMNIILSFVQLLGTIYFVFHAAIKDFVDVC